MMDAPNSVAVAGNNGLSQSMDSVNTAQAEEEVSTQDETFFSLFWRQIFSASKKIMREKENKENFNLVLFFYSGARQLNLSMLQFHQYSQY